MKSLLTAVAPRNAVRWRVFNVTLGTSFAMSLAFVVTMNVAIDPYGVFGSRLLTDGPLLNERVVKLRHVLAQREPYDVLLVGSSVMGVVPPSAWAHDGRSFNMSFFSATPGHIARTLAALENAKRLPRTLIIGVDPFLLASPDLASPQMRLPPTSAYSEQWQFWREFLFASSLGSSLSKAFDHFGGSPAVVFDRTSGAYRLAIYEASIAHDPLAHARRHFNPALASPSSAVTFESELSELRELAGWLAVRPQVEVVWVLLPVHRIVRHQLGALFDRYRASVASIAGDGLVDLTNAAMTEDDTHWYERKHFRPQAAVLLGQRIRAALKKSEPWTKESL